MGWLRRRWFGPRERRRELGHVPARPAGAAVPPPPKLGGIVAATRELLASSPSAEDLCDAQKLCDCEAAEGDEHGPDCKARIRLAQLGIGRCGPTGVHLIEVQPDQTCKCLWCGEVVDAMLRLGDGRG